MQESPSEHLQRMGHKYLYQMALVGIALNLWTQTEMVIEMVIKDALKLTVEEASIVCGPLGAGAKVALLKSLMTAHETKPDFVAAVTQFQAIIGRNALAHGFAMYDDVEEPWFIVSREVKDKLTVKTKLFVRYLEDDIMPAFERVMDTSGFTDDDLHKYGEAITALARRD